MEYGQFEDAIVELLKMPGVDVKPLPHTAVLNAPRKTTKPIYYVIVNGGQFEQPEELGAIAQLETIQGEIFIRATKRRGDLGIFDLYERAATRLLGHRLPGTKHAITFNEFGYVSGIQNNWQFALTFTFTAYRIQADDADEAPYIKRIDTNIDAK